MDASAATWEQHREPDAYVLKIVGDVDLSNSTELQRAIARLCMRARDADVVLDLADVRFIDSSGLRALYEGSRRGTSNVRLREPAPHVQRLLEIALPGCFETERLAPPPDLERDAGGGSVHDLR